MQRPPLTIDILCHEAAKFAQAESTHSEPLLFGVDNGKAIGTYVEHKFQAYLALKYEFPECNAAFGIDFASLEVDLKVTSITQPQSSCPFRSARQKIFGLGYNLLVFVYDKKDDPAVSSATLTIRHVIFVEKERTGDYQTTNGLRQILVNNGNVDDLIGFMRDRNLPLDDIEAHQIAEELLKNPPEIGYLTISNALQWRLQYARVISSAGQVNGILRIR